MRIRPAYLIGHLHLLWHAALEQAEDGDLTRWSDEFIAESADFPGDAPQFVRLLQDHKWLDGKLLHDWPDYAGKYLVGKYAKDHRDKLVAIWAKHGRIYGEKKAKGSPTDSQQNPNQIPRTPLGKVGDDSSGEEGGPGEEGLRAALVSAFGLCPVTPEEHAELAQAVAFLAAKGAQPTDVPAALAAYRKAWPTAADTLRAILRHFDRFRPRASAPAENRVAAHRAAADAEWDRKWLAMTREQQEAALAPWGMKP